MIKNTLNSLALKRKSYDVGLELCFA